MHIHTYTYCVIPFDCQWFWKIAIVVAVIAYHNRHLCHIRHVMHATSLQIAYYNIYIYITYIYKTYICTYIGYSPHHYYPTCWPHIIRHTFVVARALGDNFAHRWLLWWWHHWLHLLNHMEHTICMHATTNIHTYKQTCIYICVLLFIKTI